MTPSKDDSHAEAVNRYEASRSLAARDAYIRWRMTDLPSIYTALMPPTSDMLALWNAERGIREMHAADLQREADHGPWMTLGPEPGAILDRSAMSAAEMISIGIASHPDDASRRVPRLGREREAWQTDEHQARVDAHAKREAEEPRRMGIERSQTANPAQSGKDNEHA